MPRTRALQASQSSTTNWQRRGGGTGSVGSQYNIIAEQGQPGQFGMRDGGKVAGVRARSCIKLFFPTTTPSSIIRLRLIIDKSLASVSPGMQNPVEPAKSSRRGRLGCP